ncbi:hypothetical protein GCK32_004323 [Trichostrongylus colubriformis]|uniref:DUF1758 domain-containing protein n=1 Tax=Trichostrongylus colubriformis TaxID=6319 RepID=A0AAN8GDT0_TRICO
MQIVRNKRLCFNCLLNTHRTSECLSKRCCQHCSRHHHTSICFKQSSTFLHPARTTTKTQAPKPKGQVHFAEDSIIQPIKETTAVHTEQLNELAASHAAAKSVLMMCTEINVFNPTKPHKLTKTLAFLDSGSSRSYITTELAQLLELPGGQEEDISMYTFGTLSPLQLSTTLHTLGIHTKHGVRILNVKALETLVNDIKTVEVDNYSHLQMLTATPRKPSLLIGSDYFWDLLLCDDFHVETLPNGYHLIHSSIGKIVTGTHRLHTKTNHCYNFYSAENEELNKLVHRFWDLESQGIVDNPHSSDDEECLRKFNETTYFDNDEHRYVVQLPFKGKKEELPNNLQLAYARLLHNVKTLRLKPGMIEKYHNLIQEQLARDIIEEKTFSKVVRTHQELAVYTGHRRRLLLAILLSYHSLAKPCSDTVPITASEET